MSDFKMPVGGKVSDAFSVTAPITETENRYGFGIPSCDMDDPGQVEAWFAPGSYSHYEHFRKVVLAGCRELVRARSTGENAPKLSEARIDDQARLHPLYMTYLMDSLEGRSIRETMIRQRMGI